MVVGHGGDWKAGSLPYGSMAAVVAAYNDGSDGVKIDVRVTKDNVPVVSHSSPFEAWESLDCYGKKIEEMTAAAVTKCHFLGSSETYQRLDTMLNYARGKLVVQLTVKEPADYARAIAEVVALKAEDFAFFEVSVQDLQTTLSTSTQVWWLVNIGSELADVDTLLNLKNPHAFMVEFDASAAAATAISTKIHPAGLRSFTYVKSEASTESDFKALFDQGYDVVSSNAASENLKARIAANTAKGISPP
jgi:glycerophosphoryl diester phosphodiesterase